MISFIGGVRHVVNKRNRLKGGHFPHKRKCRRWPTSSAWLRGALSVQLLERLLDLPCSTPALIQTSPSSSVLDLHPSASHSRRARLSPSRP